MWRPVLCVYCDTWFCLLWHLIRRYICIVKQKPDFHKEFLFKCRWTKVKNVSYATWKKTAFFRISLECVKWKSDFRRKKNSGKSQNKTKHCVIWCLVIILITLSRDMIKQAYPGLSLLSSCSTITLYTNITWKAVFSGICYLVVLQ